ncbi:MAG: hypothetical protein DI626_06820, partial [Micavibrio aeruginosavorus]
VTVSTSDDLLAEGTETFTVLIDNMTNTSTVSATSNGQIVDNELYLDFIAPSGTIAENGGTYNATIKLNQIHTHDVVVTYSTVSGTAGSSDYTVVTNQTVTILAGQTTVFLPIAITDDFAVEPSETFQIQINSVVDVTTSLPVTYNNNPHTVTITDNDLDLSLSLASPNTVVSENAGTAVFTISLNNAHSKNIVLTYNTSNGTATAGSDYTGTGGNQTVIIPAGQTSVTISIPITNDTLYEGASETFNVNLVSAADVDGYPVQISGATLHQVIIQDDDVAPVLSLNTAPSPENVDYTFEIELNAPASHNVTGTWTFLPGTATAADFNNGAAMPSGTFTILAGSTSVIISVPVTDDAIAEGYEDFTIRLDNITGANATPVIGTGQIVDDELAVGFTETSATVVEGASHTAVIELSYATLEDVVVTYEIVGIDATGGSDFIAATGTVTIAAGQTTATILAQTLQDTLNESNEQFKIRLTGVSTTGPVTPTIPVPVSEKIITIDDDELDPAISMTVPGFVNENGGAQIVSVERSTNSGVTNSVNVRFDGAGFTVTYNGVTYNPGQMFTVAFSGFLNSQNITFTPINNGTFNGDSTVTVTLSDPVNARLPSTTYSFSLLDDEASTTEEYGYGYPGPIIDGNVHGALVGDDGRNVLSIGETVIASIIRNVTVDPKSGIDQVRMQTQTGVHHILDNEVLAGADGRAIIELTTGAAGNSIVSGNIIHASAKGDDIVALRTLGGAVGAVSSNKIYLAEGTFAGPDGANDLTLTTLNASAGSVVTQNSVGVIGNNIVAGGDGDDIVTVRTAGNNAGTWSGQVSALATGSINAVSAAMLKDGGYAVAYQSSSSAYYMIMNMDGSTRVTSTTLNGSGYAPEIAVLENGNIVFAYHNNTSGQDIRIKIVAPDGTTVLADTAIVTSGTTLYPQIASVKDGGFVVTWYDGSSIATITRYNASGTQTYTENINQTGSELAPAIAALQNGGYVVTWMNNATGNHDVYFQRYNADNSKAGGIVAVSNGGQSDSSPQIKTLQDGGFVIAWYNPNTQDGNHAITASIYNADGTLRTGNVLVTRTTGLTENLAEIVPLSDGGFIVTYYRANFNISGQSSAQDTYMARFDKDGHMVGDEVRLSTYGASSNDQYANIIEMRDGNLMVVYSDAGVGGVISKTITPPGASIIQGNDFALGDGANRLIVDAQSGTGRTALNDAYDQNSGGSGSVISGNRITSGSGVDEVLLTASSGVGGNAIANSGGGSYNKIWTVDSTLPSSNSDQGIAVAGLADGRFGIVWSESGATGYDIFLQLHDRNGSAIGDQIVVADIGSNQLYYPSITGLADGGYVVSWQNASVTSGAIQYVIYNANGTVRVATQTLDAGASTDQQADITALSDGGFIVVWSENTTTGNYRIRVARFDEDGNAIGDQSVLTPSNGGHAYAPDVVSTPDGGYVVSWRNNSNYLDWQRFDAAGKAVTGVIASPSAYSNYYSQVTVLANGNVLVTQNYSSSVSAGKMLLYNQSGQLLQVLNDPSTYMYRAQSMPLADGGFIVAYRDSSSSVNLARYTADGVLLGSVVGLASSTPAATNDDKVLSITQVGEDSFVVAWTNGTQSYASMFKFSDTFNVGGDASVVENNTISTHGNDDSITLSSSGGTGGQAAESGAGTYGSQLVTQAGDASVIQNNTVDAGDGNDIVNLSATGGNSNYTKIDGKTAQVLDNTIITGDGNDQVNITASGGNGNALSNRVAGNMIDMGAGNDSLTSFSTHFLRNNVVLGSGDNSANITAEFFNDNKISSTTGADSIFVSGVSTAHNNQISLGSGNDSFTLASSTVALAAGRGQTIDNLSNAQALNVPQTVLLSNGNYVTTWYESVSGNTNVYAQIFDKNGQAIGSRIALATTASNELSPSITAISGGGFVASYADTTNQNFYLAKYNASGTQQGSTVQIPDTGASTTNYAYTPQLATLTNGNIVVARMEFNGSYYHVYRTVYDSNLNIVNSSYDITASQISSSYNSYF